MDDEEPSLEHGRGREATVARILQLVDEQPATLVGLDFCFSFPAWFFVHHRVSDVREMWALVGSHADAWLADCPWPFWGRGARPSPTTDATLLRRTEAGRGAKSVFQLYYPGAVGTSSLRGMPHLLTLQAAGLRIWPFDTFALPAVVEIYPRRFTGRVSKSLEAARRTFLFEHYGAAASTSEASTSEDAFDAYVSSREMRRRITTGAGFPTISDPQLLLEGLIWSGAESVQADQ